MRQLAGIRSVALSWQEWQGLRQIPLALLVLAMSTPDALWPADLVLLLMSVASGSWIHRYYRRVLGEVRGSSVERVGWIVAAASLAALSVMLLTVLVALAPDALPSMPGYGLALIMGIMLVVGWWVGGRVGHGKIIGASALLVWAGVLATWGILPSRLANELSGVLLAVILLVDGWINHMRLMRFLGETPKHDDGAV